MNGQTLTRQPMTQSVLEGYHFEVLDSFWLIGLNGSGPYFDRMKPSENWVIPIWQEFLSRQDELPPACDRSRYLSPCHGRETDFTFYCGCAVAEKPSQIPAGMKAIQMRSHTYAVGTVSGTLAEVERVYTTMKSWAASQGHPVNNAILWFESYPNGPTLQAGQPHFFQIYLPVDNQ